MRVAIFALLLAAGCSFDLGEHPSACQATADCAAGYVCEEDLCVRDGVAPGDVDAPTSGDGDGDGDGNATGSNASGGGGSGATPGDGGGGSGGSDSPVADAGSLDAGASDAAVADAAADGGLADAGPVADPVEPYSSCAGDDDCNPGDQCRINGSRGSCGAPCGVDDDCPDPPPGIHTATPICDEGHCRIDCAPLGVPPLARSCPQGMSCVTEGIGVLTCFES